MDGKKETSVHICHYNVIYIDYLFLLKTVQISFNPDKKPGGQILTGLEVPNLITNPITPWLSMIKLYRNAWSGRQSRFKAGLKVKHKQIPFDQRTTLHSIRRAADFVHIPLKNVLHSKLPSPLALLVEV